MICSLLLRVDLLLIKKKRLFFEFEMKDLGELKKVLSMEIERGRKSGKICLTQKGYLQKVLQKNINRDTKFVSTSLALHFKLKTTMSLTKLKRMSTCVTFPMLAQLVV